MRRADELHAALGNGARRLGFEFAPDLVNDDDFGVVIFNGFDHHFMLKHGLADLHTARLAHGRMRHIAVAADLIGCIHDDHAFIFREDARGFTQEGGLANTGRPRIRTDLPDSMMS